ncbi:hypothetical protein KSF78_0000678 [Schistosoma japonicum]|nr:hypothetical protein KSF78_0000678 [Schistosoma japonicum]
MSVLAKAFDEWFEGVHIKDKTFIRIKYLPRKKMTTSDMVKYFSRCYTINEFRVMQTYYIKLTKDNFHSALRSHLTHLAVKMDLKICSEIYANYTSLSSANKVILALNILDNWAFIYAHCLAIKFGVPLQV